MVYVVGGWAESVTRITGGWVQAEPVRELGVDEVGGDRSTFIHREEGHRVPILQEELEISSYWKEGVGSTMVSVMMSPNSTPVLLP